MEVEDNLQSVLDKFGADTPLDTTADTSFSSDSTDFSHESGGDSVQTDISDDLGEDFAELDAQLLAEFDAIGSERETSTDDKNASSLLSKTGDAAPNSPGAAESQSQDEPDKSETDAQEKEKSSEPDGRKSEELASDANDWDKTTEEEEKYINSLPKPEREQARRWFKNSRMQTTFLNPAVPADQWVNNLKAKSEMRFGEVETAILRQGAEDPIKLLSRIYEATQDKEGFSENYARLLDTAIKTNKDYVVDVLKREGLNVSEAVSESSPANTDNSTQVKSAELEELENSFAFQQLTEAFPEEAEKILAGLKERDALKEQLAKNPAEKSELSDEEKQKAETEKQQQEAQVKQQNEEAQARITVFESAYQENVTAHVENKLKKDYGLEVTEAEQKANPLMAFLKQAKATVITRGYGENAEDFDEGLYKWGQERPAFKQAAESMIAFAKAKEKDNAASAAKELKTFADMYLTERLKMPEVKMIDQIIKIVAKAQKSGLIARQDFAPNGFGETTRKPTDPYRKLEQELDDLR